MAQLDAWYRITAVTAKARIPSRGVIRLRSDDTGTPRIGPAAHQVLLGARGRPGALSRTARFHPPNLPPGGIQRSSHRAGARLQTTPPWENLNPSCQAELIPPAPSGPALGAVCGPGGQPGGVDPGRASTDPPRDAAQPAAAEVVVTPGRSAAAGARAGWALIRTPPTTAARTSEAAAHPLATAYPCTVARWTAAGLRRREPR